MWDLFDFNSDGKTSLFEKVVGIELLESTSQDDEPSLDVREADGDELDEDDIDELDGDDDGFDDEDDDFEEEAKYQNSPSLIIG